jgi:hypothetical protein
MTFIDHLKGNNPEKKYLEMAIGRHVIEGDLAKSIVTGSSPTHVVTVQQMLGDALGRGWKGPIGVWFRGINRDSSKYKFYPGIMSPSNADAVQGIDAVFDLDTPHSNSAWIRCELPNGSETGIPDFDTKNNPPTGLTGIYETQLGDIYNSSGLVTSINQYITNPADAIAFGCMEIRRYPTSRINWASLATLRTACDQTVTPDWTILPQGVGLTGNYYDGTNFNTFKAKRIDPVIEFDASNGGPDLAVGVDNFSIRWEGKIRPRYTETYTFYLTHDNGGRLWVNDLVVPLIDQWQDDGEHPAGTHSATIALTADQFYDIRVDWNEATITAQIMLEWQSTSQSRQVIPQDRLYPKADPIKRFECHVAFTQPATFDEYLKAVLFTCNGAYQDVNGKLSFFNIDDAAASYAFDATNIVDNKLQFYPRFSQQELFNLPNRFLADGRDLDSRYLEKFDPPLYYDLPDLQELSGRVIEEVVPIGNSNRWQALTNLAHYAKIRTAPMVAEFDGLPQTLGVMPADKVTVTHELSGWTDKQFLTFDATDKSIDAGPDERIFKLIEW